MVQFSVQKSTIVRSFTRLGFGSLERLAPSVGARLAERVWFRLPGRAPATTGLGDRLPTIRELLGAPFAVTLRGRTIRGWVWGEGPVVYLVHGRAGSAEQLVPLVAPLLDRGLRVVAFDALSHGASDPGVNGPTSSDAAELGRSLDAVAARFGPARAVVAHSLGALGAVLALRDGWVAAERLVLVAPVVSVPDLLARFRTELGFGARTERRLAERSLRRTGYAVDDLVLPALLDPHERPALLVVHDLLDRDLEHAASAALVAAWPGAELYSTAGLGHRRVLADRAVGGAIARFVDRLPVEASLHGGEAPAPWPVPSRDGVSNVA
ncbi:alpha/beta hydrolase [Intrasporangium oryzae NRRL B-24470]|uniref:Alpha/beta hydrolase n=1 Tax=Intrasporangium oryzae NRRL B-24470 TaxID=1386089 RepID=W9GAB3_9MICO|nr:alpha/beta fold hydrolase [Intrasporangium oryzae]EWT00819.1 alpha/beta hydrolase [Intrasporangium oryzae NRRL B-24470]